GHLQNPRKDGGDDLLGSGRCGFSGLEGMGAVMAGAEQGTSGGASEAEIRAEVLQAEQRLKEVRGSRDPERVARELPEIYADDIVDIHASGWVYTKALSVELSVNNSTSVRAPSVRATSSEPEVIVLGPDAAVVM